MPVNSAENAIKKSIMAFYLLDINYPSEAIDCSIQLYLALELLLKEKYKQANKPAPWKANKLIQDFWEWNDEQKEQAHWLRDMRNMLQHAGEAKWEEEKSVRRKLLNVFMLVGKIYQSLGYKLSDLFTTAEQIILIGNELDWMEEARCLATGSLKYIEVDPEIAIDIANRAFEEAFRGYASCCRISSADTLPLSELIEALKNNYYLLEADVPVSWEAWQCTGYIRDKVELNEGGDSYYYLRPNPLIDYSELTRFADRHGEVLVFRKALDRNQAIVDALIADSPNWDYFECIAHSWFSIIKELKARFPHLLIPELKKDPNPERFEMEATFGIAAWWDEEKVIYIYFQGKAEDYGWVDIHTESLHEIITKVCGEIPDDLNVEVRFEDAPSKIMLGSVVNDDDVS
jgi:hypothetical protein